jgi:hypothetical protein
MPAANIRPLAGAPENPAGVLPAPIRKSIHHKFDFVRRSIERGCLKNLNLSGQLPQSGIWVLFWHTVIRKRRFYPQRNRLCRQPLDLFNNASLWFDRNFRYPWNLKFPNKSCKKPCGFQCPAVCCFQAVVVLN